MRRVGAAKCTHAQTLPSMIRSNARVPCLVTTASKLRSLFNERGNITPRPLCQLVPGGSGGGQAIYKRFHAPKSRDISAMKETDINPREFIRAVGACEIFPDEVHERVSTEVFLGIYRH